MTVNRRTYDLIERCSLSETGGMARVIEFYIPTNFHNKPRWVPPELYGKIIPFPVPIRKSA
jgi:hypothetical protein